jgi:hypothetical protein
MSLLSTARQPLKQDGCRMKKRGGGFVERRNFKRRFVTTKTIFATRLRYWVWGGVWDAVRLGLRSDTTAMHFWLSIGMFAYGNWILLPFDTISIGLEVIKEAFPEWAIGLLLIVTGRFGLHALASGSERLLCQSSRYNSCAYLALLVASLLSNYLSLAVPVYCVAFGRACWVNYRQCTGKGKGCADSNTTDISNASANSNARYRSCG